MTSEETEDRQKVLFLLGDMRALAFRMEIMRRSRWQTLKAEGLIDESEDEPEHVLLDSLVVGMPEETAKALLSYPEEIKANSLLTCRIPSFQTHKNLSSLKKNRRKGKSHKRSSKRR